MKTENGLATGSSGSLEGWAAKIVADIRDIDENGQSEGLSPEDITLLALESIVKDRINAVTQDIEKFWRFVEMGYDIEPRAYFEKEARTNGFDSPLAQAAHHMWKRDPKVADLQRQLAEAQATITALTQENQKLKEKNDARVDEHPSVGHGDLPRQPPTLSEQLPDIEIVSAAVHDAWVRQKQAKGFTSALSQQTGEEQMRPYAELSEQVKEYDRATVRAVYDAIRAAKHDAELCQCGARSAPLALGAYCRRCHKPTAH